MLQTANMRFPPVTAVFSAIVNYDPDFRLTFYYVEQGRHGDVYYTRVDVEVGDDKIKNKEMMRIATAADVDRRQD